MTDYKQFCKRYGLDPATDDARAQYRAAQDNLRALYSVAAKDETGEAIDRAKSGQKSALNAPGD